MANALGRDYGRFTEVDISNGRARLSLNALIEKANGLVAINAILYGNEIGAQSLGRDSQPVSPFLLGGLMCAAVQLSEAMAEDLDALGMHIGREAKW